MVNKVLPYSNVVIKSLISCNILSRFCDDIKKIILEYSNIDIRYLIRETRFILSNMYPSLYIHIKEKPKIIQNPETISDYIQPLLNISSNTHSNIKHHNTLNLIRDKKIEHRKKYCKKDKTKHINYDRSVKYDFLDNNPYIYEDKVDNIFEYESRYDIYDFNNLWEIDMENYYRWTLRDDSHYY